MHTWTDTHCHLNNEELLADVGNIQRRAKAVGVRRIITVGYDLLSSERAAELADPGRGQFAAVGMHPYEAAETNEETIKRLTDLAARPGVVAIGEIGLDFYRGQADPETQQRAFELQLSLATTLDLPVIIHCRDAWDQVLATLERFPGRGVLHCFSGTAEQAERGASMGWMIGVGGVITFKNAESLREAVHRTPLDHILLETDAPYLAPMPHRGKTNVPEYIPIIGAGVALAKNLEPGAVSAATEANAARLFNLPETD